MKILKWIGIISGTLVVLLAVVGLLLPRRYHVARSVVINAQPEVIHPSINTPKEWPEWSVWTVEKYPDMKISYSGPESGVGAIDEFDGESVGGHGKFEITQSDPAKGIGYSLDFNHGQYVSTGQFIYEPAGSGTKVTWTNDGDLGWNPISRYCGAFGLMDKMMGPDFQAGLDKLKTKVEAEAAETGTAGEKPGAEPTSEEPAPPAEEAPAPSGETKEF